MEEFISFDYVFFSPQQPQTFHELSRLFSKLLADSAPVVRQFALETFAYFAEKTTHESVVAESLETDEALQQTVVIYLNKVKGMAIFIVVFTRHLFIS